MYKLYAMTDKIDLFFRRMGRMFLILTRKLSDEVLLFLRVITPRIFLTIAKNIKNKPWDNENSPIHGNIHKTWLNFCHLKGINPLTSVLVCRSETVISERDLIHMIVENMKKISECNISLDSVVKMNTAYNMSHCMYVYVVFDNEEDATWFRMNKDV